MFFGVYGGFLKDFIVIDLFEFVVKVVLFVGKVLFEIVDSVIMGNVLQSFLDVIYLVRYVGLCVGILKEILVFMINRFCGFGFQFIVNGCQEICVKEVEVVLCGGIESMS